MLVAIPLVLPEDELHPIGLILAALNLALIYIFTLARENCYSGHTYNHTKLFTVTLGMVDRILLKSPLASLYDDVAELQAGTIEQDILKRLDWKLIYQPFCVGPYTPAMTVPWTTIIPHLTGFNTYQRISRSI